MNDLKQQLLVIKKDLDALQENGCTEEYDSVVDYLNSEALDVEYTHASNGMYLGSRIYVTLGGPTIYIDTRYGQICGHWGRDVCELDYECDELDELMELTAEGYF